MQRNSDDTPQRRQWRWEATRTFLAVGRFVLWLISWERGSDPCDGAAAA